MRIIFPTILIVIFLFFLFTGNKESCVAANQVGSADTLPYIILKPSYIKTKGDDGTKFITREVKVLNRGAKTLIIKRASSSCNCGSITVLDAVVEPMTIGKLMIYINLDGFHDISKTIEFYIESNASNSPASIKVELDSILPGDNSYKDSLDIK